jgi:autotransporter-associated beta strand protein
MKPISSFIGILVAVLLFVNSSPAVIYPQYEVDSDTLHLWHMNTGAPVLDEVPGGVNLTGLHNGATLGNASFTGFGSALNTVDGGQTSTAERNALFSAAAANPPGSVSITVADPDTGAFTFEALVWIGFDPAFNMGTTANGGNNRNTPLNIISAENAGSGAGRIFQFRIVPTGMVPATGQAPAAGPMLTFENIRSVSAAQPSIYAPIPLDGPHAIVSNAWYHVAVTYSGEPSVAGNIRLYWSRLDSAASAANELTITSVTTMLTGLNPKATISSPFMIGNDGRNRNSNFIGLIDEVRISRVARGSASMLLGPTEVTVVTDPAGDIVATGQPFSLSVSAGGLPPYTYQWRLGGEDIDDATNSTYAVEMASMGDAGQYDVVVANGSSSATSQTATVTVRNPLTLTWTGFGADWDTANVLWDSNGDAGPDAAYTEGDHVVFNGQGDYLVFLAQRMHPSSVSVETESEYMFSTDAGGALERNMSLTKKGNGQLTVETINTYTGGTDIRAGTLQVGSIIGAGGIGSGAITNNGSLVVSNGSVATPFVTGSGSLTVHQGTTFSMDTNLLTGALTMYGGTVNMTGPQAVGNLSSITMHAKPNPGPSLNMRGGTLPATISMLGTTASPDTRVTINAQTGTNVILSPLIVEGDGTVQLITSPEGFMDLAGMNSPGFNGKILLRGSGTNNVVRGPINIGLQVSVADSSTWTFLAPNSWAYGEAAHTSTFRIGAAGALPPASALNVWGGTLDLAGFNAQVGYLTSTNTGSPFAQNFTGKIGNSSTTSDSVFTVHSALNNNALTAAIMDSVHGGTRKTGLTLSGGGTLTLGNPTNTYSGDTLISSGTLVLSNAGAILNSANIIIAAGSKLDATLRADQTLTISPVQTLKGDGAITVLGKLVNQGALEFKVSKSGGGLSGDQLQELTDLTYGGSLKLVLSGQPLADGDSIKLFDAGTYQGAFAAITPASPGAGLRWDTSELTASGTLRVATGPATTPPSITFAMEGDGIMKLEWPETHKGWLLQAQTNSVAVGLSDNWVPVNASLTTNRLFIPVDQTQGAVFHRMILP